MVRIASPPPERSIDPRFVQLPAGTSLVRIYNPTYLGPSEYNHHGPRNRFDHHAERALHTHDPERGIYYAAPTLAGCVVEVFGDTGVIEAGPYRVAVVQLAMRRDGERERM